MTQVFLTTTGTVPVVTIDDIGGVQFVHPVSNQPLILPAGFLSEEEVSVSTGLAAAAAAGEINLTDSLGNPIAPGDLPTSGSALPGKNSIQIDNGAYQLVSDTESPGPDFVYGTDGSGNKGWVLNTGAGGASVQFIWKFNDSTSIGNPGGGQFRVNNSNPANVTRVLIADETENDFDASAILSSLSENNRLYIQQVKDSSRYLLCTVTAAGLDNGSWWDFTVTVDDSGALFEDGEECGIVIFSNVPNVIPMDLPAVEKRRTTQLNPIPTGAFTELTFDVIDVENNTDILEANLANTAAIDVKETGLYLIAYSMAADDEVDAEVVVLPNTRLEGSFFSVGDKGDTNQIFTGCSKTFIAELTAGDQIAVRVVAQTGAEFLLEDSTFTVVRLTGVKGDKGDQGDQGVGTLTTAFQSSDIASGIDRINFISPEFFFGYLGGTSIDVFFDNPFAVAEYRNTNTSTNLNVSNDTGFPTAIPILGFQVRLDPAFSLSGTNGYVCNFDGWVKAEANVHFFSGGTRNCVQIRFKLNGAMVGPIGSSSYIRATSGHNESSAHISEYIQVSNGDIISLHARREGNNTSTTVMQQTTSSNFILTRTPEV